MVGKTFKGMTDAMLDWPTARFTELAVGGTDGSDPNFTPGGFVFQDKEADVEAEFQKNLAFALDLARSTTQPDNPVSHLGNTAPDMVPNTFPTSYGTPQTVEVNAKRSLGRVSVHWTVNGGREHSASTSEWKGGERYGEPGVYYHRLRAQIGGTHPGDSLKVWFEAKKSKTKPFCDASHESAGFESCARAARTEH